jgi:heterodisulfide reductase subunit A2
MGGQTCEWKAEVSMAKKIGKALVVGAGISGIRAALDLAEYGYGVTLIDRSAHIGGILNQLDDQFPTDRCGMCKMLPLVDRDAGSQYCLRKGLFHENIDILLATELVAVEGEAGRFQVTLKQQPSWVNPQACVGCGKCAEICPVEVPDDFNAGLTTHKAISLPVPHAIPNSYVIDFSACNRCGACADVCPTDAIHLPERIYEGFRILVVDDELIVRDSLKEWLGEEGFAVDMAASGGEAMELLARQTYHLMLLDIKMPGGMDGVEVLQKAAENFPDVNVIMMTAYATIETAVEAMKMGALDYLIKPFDPKALIAKVLHIYQDLTAAQGRQMEVGALVLCGGSAFFDPASGKNTFGYGVYPNIVTNLQFERMLSGTGPYGGRPLRPSDGKPLNKVAWIQCVGCRDLQTDADFCATICCMISIKEALLAKEKIRQDLETTIFYMDMRTFGKSFQRYREQAETLHGVRFERGRIHSLERDAGSGDMILRSVDISGKTKETPFDMLVLAVGQRPAAGTPRLAEMLGLELNPWGFGQTKPFSMTRSNREGILLGGSFTGLKDISDSITQASAAALSASRVIHSSGGSLALEPLPAPPVSGLAREIPQILVAVCTCGDRLSKLVDPSQMVRKLKTDPLVKQVEFLEKTCTAEGWEHLVELVQINKPNRILIGACRPYVYQRKLHELAGQVELDAGLMEVVDLRLQASDQNDLSACSHQLAALQMGVAKLKRANPLAIPTTPVVQRALVVGGGIAGMTAALAIADHGFRVDLIEQAEQLGGNLNWLQQTLDGHSAKDLLKYTCLFVEKHPKIEVHIQSQVMNSVGQVGRFQTTIESSQHGVQTIAHGVIILATGGTEAVTSSYGYGTHPGIITQKEFEQRLVENTIDAGDLSSVVMIQCVDSREEPRNYCSRICCVGALKHALQLKQQNPATMVYILYRDMMTYGFSETYYTQARQAGVIFIQYDLTKKPQVTSTADMIRVGVCEPIIGRRIQIEADLVVLATGVVPHLRPGLAETLGVALDRDGFFQEAESKWRPVDALKEGVFACGLAHSPRNIAETIATAEAAAQRALRILARERLPAGKVVAKVRPSLCCLCERCIDACPYAARTLDLDNERVLVNALMCQGCGCCAAVCPNGAALLEGFPEQQLFEMIDAAIG